MKYFKNIIPLILMLVFLLASADAEAKWWIFGQSNEDVTINYLYINKTAFEEGGQKITIYKETLQDGLIRINGKASMKKGNIGGVRVSINDRETWDDAKFSDNGAFEFIFKPELNTTYIIYVEVMDTSGKTNDVEATRREVSLSDENIRAVIKAALDAMFEAYRNEDAASFMRHVSSDFAGDDTNLDRAIRRDFSFFENINMRYTLNNIASNSQGIFVSVNFNRSLISSKSGMALTDRGTTEFVFRLAENGPLVFSMKNPLIFGLSDAANVATGTVWGTGEVIVVGENGNAETMPFADAIGFINGEDISDVESGTNILLSTTLAGHPPTGFDFAAAAEDPAGDFMITGFSNPAKLYGFLNAGVWVKDLGVVSIGSITEAPDTGYSQPIAFEPETGHAYAFKLASGKYALMEIKSINIIGLISFRMDYKYQPDGSRNMQ